jgi:HlyD family secretion protein
MVPEVAISGRRGIYSNIRMANGHQPRQKRRLWPILVAIVAGVLLLAAFMSMRRSVAIVRAESVVRTTITSAISTNGKIEPMQNFEAHAPAPTAVKRILAHEGDHVKAGQLLVQLDDAEARAQAAKAQAQLQAANADVNSIRSGGTREEVLTNQTQLAKAKAELNAAQRNVDALQRLQQKGAASPAEVQAAHNRVHAAQQDVNLLSQKTSSRFAPQDVARVEAQAAEAKASLAAAQDVLNKADIRAASEGTVYSLPVRQGQFVNTGDLIVAVAPLTTVQVRAFVDEPDIAKLKQGQEVDVTWDALPGRIWKGTVTRVPTTVVTRGTRNVGEFTSEVENPDKSLLPNVNVSVLIVSARQENALTVPREAVHQDQGGRFVYEVANGELKRIAVDTSVSNLTRVAVTKGLSDNSVVALGTVNNNQALRDGMSVRVVQK